MADTGGIAALMKALNESPSLGSGLKSSGVSRSSAVARTVAPVKSTSVSQTGSAALRTARASLSSSSAGATALPKILSPEGKGYDPKAPKGSYVNLVI